MQQYNYAEEILKDDSQQLPQRRYVRYYAQTDDIFNGSVQSSLFNSTPNQADLDLSENEKKETAFKEGLKNDSINL